MAGWRRARRWLLACIVLAPIPLSDLLALGRVEWTPWVIVRAAADVLALALLIWIGIAVAGVMEAARRSAREEVVADA